MTISFAGVQQARQGFSSQVGLQARQIFCSSCITVHVMSELELLEHTQSLIGPGISS